MKRLIIVTLIILAISPLMAGYSAPPQGMKVGISDVQFGTQSVKEVDGLSGEFMIVDGHRPFKGANSITSAPSEERIDFPQFGRLR